MLRCSVSRYQVGEKYKLIRLDVPMFDNNGKLLELAERRLDFMDVVAVQTKVSLASRSLLAFCF